MSIFLSESRFLSSGHFVPSDWGSGSTAARRNQYTPNTLEQVLLSLEREARGISSVSINNWMEGAKRKEPSSSLWCPVPEQEATGINWNIGSSLWTPGSISVLYGWQSTDICCSERLWGFHLGDLQKPSGCVPWHPALSVPDGLRGPCQPSCTLWLPVVPVTTLPSVCSTGAILCVP